MTSLLTIDQTLTDMTVKAVETGVVQSQIIAGYSVTCYGANNYRVGIVMMYKAIRDITEWLYSNQQD